MREYRYVIHVPGPDGTVMADHGIKQHGDAHGLAASCLLAVRPGQGVRRY